jgi:hypothetical protein
VLNLGMTKKAAVRLTLILIALFVGWVASTASAQESQNSEGSLRAALIPGGTVWITDRGGREERARILDLTDDTLTADMEGRTVRMQTADIVRVTARHTDSIINGALIGAGAAVASGLFLCTRTEPWRNCRDDAGPMVRIGAVGAGIGIGIDALIRGKRTIYEAGRESALQAAATLTARRTALQVSFSF